MIIFCYSFIWRLFNGEPNVDPLESCFSLLEISSVLSSSDFFESPIVLLQNCLQKSLKPSINTSVPFSISVLQDIAKILSSKRLVLAALSDLYRTFQLAVETISKEASKVNKSGKRQLELATKKLYFFLVWANEQSEDTFVGITHVVIEEWERQNEILKGKKQHNPAIIETDSKSKSKKPIIEEIN